MNFNAFHNYLNFAGLIVGTLILYDWTQLGISAPTAATLTAGFLTADKVIKIGMNLFRDGLGGLFKVQPPVEK